MGNARRRLCCCGSPTTVDSACSMSGCEQSCTDGTGMELFDTPSGGTSTFAIDSVAGRSAPCYRMTSNQSGSPGVYSVVVFEDAIPYSLCSLSDLTICGEWLNSTVGNSLRIWPCLVQDGEVFVSPPPGVGNAYTNVTSTTSWTQVAGDLIQSDRLGYQKVTAYGSGTLTLSGYLDLTASASQAQIGFLVYSDGDTGVDYRAWLDNVCVQWDFLCSDGGCLPCRTDVLIECSTDFMTGLTGDCDKIQTVANTLLSGGVTVSHTRPWADSVGRVTWNYTGTEAVTGGSVSIDISLTCDAVAGGWLLNLIFGYTPTGLSQAHRTWAVSTAMADFTDCDTPFHPDSIDEHAGTDCMDSYNCCPTYADPADMTITPL